MTARLLVVAFGVAMLFTSAVIEAYAIKWKDTYIPVYPWNLGWACIALGVLVLK